MLHHIRRVHARIGPVWSSIILLLILFGLGWGALALRDARNQRSGLLLQSLGLSTTGVIRAVSLDEFKSGSLILETNGVIEIYQLSATTRVRGTALGSLDTVERHLAELAVGQTVLVTIDQPSSTVAVVIDILKEKE